MRRVWIVEDGVPVQELSYTPASIANEGVRYLIENHGGVWEDQVVRELCDSLSGPAFELTVLLSPEQLTKLVESGAEPPHVVIFDWEGPGFGEQVNRAAIRNVLESGFSFVQVYTQLGVESVEPKIQDLRREFAIRMLPAKAKEEVNATDLCDSVRAAWDDTVAGEFADGVRGTARAAIERVLIDFCSVRRTALAALLESRDQFETLLMAKLRDEIGIQGIDRLDDLIEGDAQVEAAEDLRRFQSVFYYHFPADDLVRTGDIVSTEAGGYAMVVSPQCHLVRFRKKTGGCLTLVDAEELTTRGIAALKKSGVKLTKVGSSAIANHDGAGSAVVVLPNVPSSPNCRDSLVDIAVRTHAWRTIHVDEAVVGPLTYADVVGADRLCTVTETCSMAVISHIAGVMASAGVPDFPQVERTRINEVLKAEPAANE